MSEGEGDVVGALVNEERKICLSDVEFTLLRVRVRLNELFAFSKLHKT